VARLDDFDAALDAVRTQSPVGSHDTYLADPVVSELISHAYRRKQKDRAWTWALLVEVINRALAERAKPPITSPPNQVAAYAKRKFGHAER
jgi:hypothetical protein